MPLMYLSRLASFGGRDGGEWCVSECISFLGQLTILMRIKHDMKPRPNIILTLEEENALMSYPVYMANCGSFDLHNGKGLCIGYCKAFRQ